MRILAICCVLLCGALPATTPAGADERLVLGGDAYATGSNATLSQPSPRDGLAAGFAVDILGKVEKDAFVAGFDVDVGAPVGRDLIASGFSIKVAQPVGEDLTAAGFNIHVLKDAAIGGNARLAGNTILLDAPVAGSLVAAARRLTLNGTVAGDARLTAGHLSFGPEARIGGNLTYFAPETVDIPASVIAPEKVTFQKLEIRGPLGSIRDSMHASMPRLWPSFLTMLFGFVMSLAFLIVLAAILLAIVPGAVEMLRARTDARPFRAIGLGVLGLSTLVGLIPVVAITLIGIPLVPVVMLAIVALWIAGYLLGAYVLSWRVVSAFRPLEPSTSVRLAVLAAGLVILAALHFIPFLGWLINLLVVFLGLGGLVDWALRALGDRLAAREPALPAAVPSAEDAEAPPRAGARRPGSKPPSGS